MSIGIAVAFRDHWEPSKDFPLEGRTISHVLFACLLPSEPSFTGKWIESGQFKILLVVGSSDEEYVSPRRGSVAGSGNVLQYVESSVRGGASLTMLF